MKKAVLLFMVFIILETTFGAYSTQAASSSSYSIKVGKKLTIDTSLKNATWGSDDTKIATVTQKGVVNAVSAGICTIVATANGKSELFTVKVTKSKKSNTVEILQDSVRDGYFGPPALKHAPVVYIDGNKLTFFETTYSELVNGLKESGYSIICKHEVNDIAAYDFQVEVMKKNARYASLRFKVTDSMLAKDSVVSRAEVDTTKSGFYFFNAAFKPKNMPLFEDFINSGLFSEDLNWEYSEKCRDEVKEIVCRCTVVYENNLYSLMFHFNSSTHKCTAVRLV